MMEEGSIIQMRGLIKTPSNIQISAPSLTGKTHFVIKMIEDENYIFDQHIEHIFFCYNLDQEMYEPLKSNPKVTLFKGLPQEKQLSEWADKHKGIKICIFDDLGIQLQRSENLELAYNCVSVLSHHLQYTFIFILQNLFSKPLRHLSVNTHYFVLLPYVRDQNQIKILSRQLYAEKSNTFMKIYHDALSTSAIGDFQRGYLLVDAHPDNSTNKFRLYTNIFRSQYPIVAYMMT